MFDIILKTVEKVADVLYIAAKYLSIVLVGISTIAVLTGVFFRYVLMAPLPWPEEVARYCMIWVTFLGSSMGVRLYEHVAMDFFVDKLAPKGKTVLSIALKTMTVYFLVTIIGFAFRIVFTVSATEVSPAAGIPMIIPQMAIPLGLILILVQTVYLLLKDIYGVFGKPVVDDLYQQQKGMNL